jgi:hypothetical protein
MKIPTYVVTETGVPAYVLSPVSLVPFNIAALTIGDFSLFKAINPFCT